MNIARFDPIHRFDQGGTALGEMIESPDGDWIRLEDHETELISLRAQLQGAEEALCQIMNDSNCPFCRGKDPAKHAHPGHTPHVCQHCAGDTILVSDPLEEIRARHIGDEYFESLIVMAMAERGKLKLTAEDARTYSGELTDAYLKASGKLQSELAAMKKQRDALLDWKESALREWPDLQPIGKLLGLRLGKAIGPEIVPGIERLQALVDTCRKALEVVAGYDAPHREGICPYGCDCPQIAKTALTALSRPTKEA